VLLLERYSRHKGQLDTLRQKLHDQRLARAIQEFHDSIHGEEISRQLDGILPSEYLAPPTFQYRLLERARIAKLFPEVVNVSNRDELYQLRMSLIRQLALLCNQPEEPHRNQVNGGYKPGASHKQTPSTMSTAAGSRSSSVAATASTIVKESVASVNILLVCPVCGCKRDADNLTKHIYDKHLKRRPVP